MIGASLQKAGELLQERTGVPSHYFDHLYGLQANDALIVALSGNQRTAGAGNYRAAACAIAGCHAGYAFHAWSVAGGYCRRS